MGWIEFCTYFCSIVGCIPSNKDPEWNFNPVIQFNPTTESPDDHSDMENLHLNGGDVIPVGNNEEMSAIVRKEKTWPKGRIPYVIAPSLRNKSEEIKRAMKYIEARTCIRFVPRTRESNYVYMIKNQSCSSFQGMVGGAQRLSLGNGCYKMGKILHELVHAIGFSHEQSRFDRDEYITIHWENIIPGHEKDFVKMKPQEILLTSPYDYDSIMHYGELSFSKDKKKGLKTMTAKKKGVVLRGVGEKVLSIEDINRIQKLYKCL